MAAASPSPAQLRLALRGALPLAAKPFVEGVANAEAAARLHAWTGWPGGALALTGPPGVGKSHLAARWAQAAGAAPFAPDASDGPWTGPLLIDDAQSRLGDPAFEEALFHALNAAAQGRGGPLLLVGRPPPTAWPCRLPDLRSRLNALPVAVIDEPDDLLLRALLVAFFRERSVRPGEDLLDDLVRRIERSATGAAAIVEALDAACRQGARLGRPLARALLHDPDETLDLFPGVVDENPAEVEAFTSVRDKGA